MCIPVPWWYPGHRKRDCSGLLHPGCLVFLVMSVDKPNPGGRILSAVCLCLSHTVPFNSDLYFCSRLSCSSVCGLPCSPLPPPALCFLWATLSFKHCCVMSLPFSLELLPRPEGETSDTITDGCPRNSGINSKEWPPEGTLLSSLQIRLQWEFSGFKQSLESSFSPAASRKVEPLPKRRDQSSRWRWARASCQRSCCLCTAYSFCIHPGKGGKGVFFVCNSTPFLHTFMQFAQRFHLSLAIGGLSVALGRWGRGLFISSEVWTMGGCLGFSKAEWHGWI